MINPDDLLTAVVDVQIDYSNPPPPFGASLRKFWAFEDGYVNLNHGSYGSLPVPVQAECAKIALQAERNPDKFNRFTFMPMLEECRRLVAELIGAELDEIVLVPNATHGVNIVLRNFEWKEGDILLGASTTYGAVARTLQYLGDRSEAPRPTVCTVLYKFPMTREEVLDAFRARIRELKQQYSDIHFTDVPSLSPAILNGDETAQAKGNGTTAQSGNKFVAVIDSLSSNPGPLMPWQEMVRICREEGVWSVVDAAHSIGQETNINVGETKPDFWVSNCHKWLYAKRGCAALYVPRRNQYIIKSSIPTSHDYGKDFVRQHRWTGTMDMTPFLSIKPALEFRKWLGGEAAIDGYCHNLAMEGGKRLAELLGTQVRDETGEMTCHMTDVRLPLPTETLGAEPIYTPELTAKIEEILTQKLLFDWNAFVAVYLHAGAWWCRCSAQVWNEVADFEYVAKALDAICSDIKDTLLKESAVTDKC